MEIRLETPSTQRHFDNWATIIERVSGEVFDVAELGHVFTVEPESAWLLAYDDAGTALGCGVGRRSSIGGSLYAMLRVLPEHRGRGVGSRLYAAVSEHARATGLSSLWGRIPDEDAGSLRLARNRGFREVGREHKVVLEVASTAPAPAPPPGIELLSAVERPDLVQALYRLDVEVGRDVPSHEESYEPMSYKRWHEIYFEGPGAMPEACVVALADGEPVGYTGLRRHGAASPDAENLLTAVRREWRRRGIATAMKAEQIGRARRLGVERIHTTNDETNVGMRGVNERLGYRPAPIKILVSGPLAPT